ESTSLAAPVVLMIRRVLEECRGFAEAVSLLERSRIAADCLLLVTGTRPGEMVVIERTFTRSAIRGPIDGQVVVTNEYRTLNGAGRSVDGNRLQETACGRFDRITALLAAERPSDARACLEL